MAEYLIQGTTLDAIADAINAKTGGSSAMTPAEMVTAIGSISGGGEGGAKALTKLAEYNIAEPVNSVLTPVPESMRKSGQVFLYLKNVVFTDSYLYLGVNSKSVGYFGTSQLGGSPLNVLLSVTFAAGTTIDSMTVQGMLAALYDIGASVPDATRGVFSGDALNIGLYTYINNKYFTSGTIEVWGYV